MLGTSTSTLLEGNGKMKVIKRWIMRCGGGGKRVDGSVNSRQEEDARVCITGGSGVG